MANERVLFAGTPGFARASLEALVAAGRVPVAVLTQPDRPAGRGKRLAESPVKSCAREHGIEVLQPETLKQDDVVATLESLRPDILVVAAYGLILPRRVLDIPTHGCLNVHASLLPRWRGAAPIQAAILAGDEQSGISLMEMTAGLDCGPVYATAALDIGPRETAGELHDRLAALGGRLLIDEIGPILAGARRAEPQDEALATYAPKIRPVDAEIDWTAAATDTERRIRAMNPVPGAWFTAANGERIKCWEAGIANELDGAAGEVLEAGRDGIIVACGEGALVLERLQRPGKRPVNAREFAEQLDLAGTVLG